MRISALVVDAWYVMLFMCCVDVNSEEESDEPRDGDLLLFRHVQVTFLRQCFRSAEPRHSLIDKQDAWTCRVELPLPLTLTLHCCLSVLSVVHA